jgi:hypothetical protein
MIEQVLGNENLNRQLLMAIERDTSVVAAGLDPGLDPIFVVDNPPLRPVDINRELVGDEQRVMGNTEDDQDRLEHDGSQPILNDEQLSYMDNFWATLDVETSGEMDILPAGQSIAPTPHVEIGEERRLREMIRTSSQSSGELGTLHTPPVASENVSVPQVRFTSPANNALPASNVEKDREGTAQEGYNHVE